MRKESLKAPPGWFVGMMCVISFLLFIIALVCIVKRRRGQQYPVDEKERQLGRDGGDPPPHDDRYSFGEYARRYIHFSRTMGVAKGGSWDPPPNPIPLKII